MIPAGVRFQVCLPGASSAIDAFFDDTSQWRMVHAAYIDGIHAPTSARRGAGRLPLVLRHPGRPADGRDARPRSVRRLSNDTVKAADRRIDYVHMRVVRHPGPDFFALLDGLDIGDTKVYLGLIHHTDGVDGDRERSEAARKHLADFDVHAACARDSAPRRRVGSPDGLP